MKIMAAGDIDLIDLMDKYEEWMSYDKNENTRCQLAKLKEAGYVNDLTKLLSKRMEFGTAGLRARMGPGYSQMNDLTIIQTAQGLLRYCEQTIVNLKSTGIVLGYDGRHNSHKWARVTANIFVRAGVKVYLYSRLCPTPFVPFNILHSKASCGVMVTASHNPKDDNGYKVYWSNSAQIVTPHDKGIAASILKNLEPWETSWHYDEVESSPLCVDNLDEVCDAYYTKQKAKLCHYFEENKKSTLKFTYTAMHGVGYPFVQRMFETFGFQHMVPVEKQILPDPEFPTVVFPNPEEGRSALDLSIEAANASGSPIILANDPDADRLAVAEKSSNGQWKILSGNEIGALIGWWIWKCVKNADPHIRADNVYMYASTVSSKILRAIAQKEGFNFEETLTGFKWMGNKAHEHMQENRQVLFAFEEAIGFMCGDEVLDKDGVGAIGVMGELAIHLYAKGLTLGAQLEHIYKEYGYHVTNNSYYFCYDQATIKKMFDRLRNWNDSGNYPTACGPYKITATRDLHTGYDSNYPDLKARLPVSSSSQMVTFTFENGCVATIRTSGTEPKIKYYSEYCARPTDTRDYKEMNAELADLIKHIIQEFYEPEKNGLTPRKD